MTPRVEKTSDGSEVTYTEFPPDPSKLQELFTELFSNHWKEITFGPCVDGAVYEIVLQSAPQSVHYRSGYFTVETGGWHFHLCLENTITARRPSRAAFFESKNQTCVPMSFGFRMWNGSGEQMITVFFPNPYLNADHKVQKQPEWSRLELWKHFKSRYAGDAVQA